MTETEQQPMSQEPVVPPAETPTSIQLEPVLESPVEPSQAGIPTQSESTPIIPNVSAQLSPKSFLAKALESIQFRKKAKLEKIMKLANEKKVITNDDVEKLLHVSDATATRYLSTLVKQNRLKVSGNRRSVRYEPFN